MCFSLDYSAPGQEADHIALDNVGSCLVPECPDINSELPFDSDLVPYPISELGHITLIPRNNDSSSN